MRGAGASGTSDSSLSMSSGRATTTGPGRPEAATVHARAITSDTRSADSISVTHLASPPNIWR